MRVHISQKASDESRKAAKKVRDAKARGESCEPLLTDAEILRNVTMEYAAFVQMIYDESVVHEPEEVAKEAAMAERSIPPSAHTAPAWAHAEEQKEQKEVGDEEEEEEASAMQED